MKVLSIDRFALKNQIAKSNKKNEPENEQEKNVNFNGVSRILAKKIYPDGQREILARLGTKHRNSMAVGQLPKAIFDRIPAKLRNVAIPEILKAFDIAALSLRDFNYPDIPREYFGLCGIQMPSTEVADNALTSVFRKYGIIGEKDSINFEYFGKGISSKSFKISGIKDNSIEDDDFLLKVYYRVINPDWHAAKTHGVHAELNNAMYWRAQAGQNTQKGKFYFGNLESGYMVTNILSEDSRWAKNEVSPYHFGLNYDRLRPATPSHILESSTVKNYNYSHSGMPVVNRIKNESKYARTFLEKMDKLSPEDRVELWNKIYAEADNNETKLAALALGIKYMKNKKELMDIMLDKKMPKVNEALAYVLKYMKKNDALEYFDKLVQTKEPMTQVILFNEIPLLGKRFDKTKEIKDDVHISLMEIIPDKIEEFYAIAEKHALPETIEHLASSVYMLPITKLEAYYERLAKFSVDNPALKERLGWKIGFLPADYREKAQELIGLNK